MENSAKEKNVEPVYLLLASTAVEISTTLRHTLRKDILGREELVLAEAVWYLLFQIDFNASLTMSEDVRVHMTEAFIIRIGSDIGYGEAKHADAFQRLAQHRIVQYARILEDIKEGSNAKSDEELRMKLPKLFCANLSCALINTRFSEDALPISGNPEHEAHLFDIYTEYILPIESHFRHQLLELLNHL